MAKTTGAISGNSVLFYNEGVLVTCTTGATLNITNETLETTCKDNDGVECNLSIITRKKQGNRKQLYINYGDQIIVYNIFNID